MKTGKTKAFRLAFSIGFLVAVVLGFLNRNAIYDWFRLRNYQPSVQIAQLATSDTMTTYAKHMFYVNHPVIQTKNDFNNSCPNNGGEQTIILGCYHPREVGIFMYSVTDPQLSGVEEVTAAHETLHAIYDRLSMKDRNYVNGLLENYYNNDLHDQRLRDTIAAYQKSEPNDVVNEMHSIFGSEVASLPPALETYYHRYFTNRSKVAAYATAYQSSFTNKQAQADQIYSQIKAIEQQLGGLKQQIDGLEESLRSRGQNLQAEFGNTTNVPAYNAQVDAYNADVAKYRNLINTYNALINQHNQLVIQYKAIALETNKLIQELNSRSATVSSQ